MPFAYPPRGWLLAAVVLLWLVLGNVGHDPWKGDDATYIGVTHWMLKHGDWLVPQLSGDVFPDYPPLFFWLGVFTARLFGWLLPLHDAIRLAGLICGAVSIAAVGFTARLLYGEQALSLAVLLMIGSIGLLTHFHDAQPMLAVLAATALAYYGLALITRRPWAGAAVTGLALGLIDLAGGYNSMLFAAPLAVLLPALSPDWRNRSSIVALALSLLIGAGIALGHYLLLQSIDPGAHAQWLNLELGELSFAADPLARFSDLCSTLPWFAWPVLPLALWGAWTQRKTWRSAAWMLPVSTFLLGLLLVVLTGVVRQPVILPLLLPLVLLATYGVPLMRRGLANAFDWFGMMSMTFFMFLVWVGWVAMITGWPPRLARQVTRIEPGFELSFSLPAFAFAVLLTLAWLALIMSATRSNTRATVHWAAGVLAFWGLVVALWLPWVDYGKSYRAVSASLATALKSQPRSCIIGRTLGDPQRASFQYFNDIVTHDDGARGTLPCRLLLVQTAGRAAPKSPGAQWRKVWEDRRRGDRNENFRLYVRD